MHLQRAETDDSRSMKPSYLLSHDSSCQKSHTVEYVCLPSVAVEEKAHHPCQVSVCAVPPAVAPVHSKHLHQHRRKQYAGYKVLPA